MRLLDKIFKININPISPIDDGNTILVNEGDLKNIIAKGKQLSDYGLSHSICPLCKSSNTMQNANERENKTIGDLMTLNHHGYEGVYDLCYKCGNMFFIIKEKDENI